MAPTMLEELCKRIQHCWATLRRSRNKRNVGSCWLKSLTGFKLCATTSNNMQQGLQTDATCNIQQCCGLLANNVASVYTQPKISSQNMRGFDHATILSPVSTMSARNAWHNDLHFVSSIRRKSPGGTSRKIGWACAARFLKPLPYFRADRKFETLFQT